MSEESGAAFAQRIEERLRDAEDHPERWQIVQHCTTCGAQYPLRMSREEVELCLKQRGSTTVSIPWCESCYPDKPDEGEE